MTVLFGLKDRLERTRLIVFIDAGRKEAGLEIIASLPERAAVVATAGSWTPDVCSHLQSVWAQYEAGRRLAGIDISQDDNPAVRQMVESLQPDFVIENQLTPKWPHQWALHGLWSIPQTKSDFDFFLVKGQSALVEAARLMPPTPEKPANRHEIPKPTKPWFGLVSDFTEVEPTIEIGAARLAWQASEPTDDFAQTTELLRQTWQKNHPDVITAIRRR